MTHTLKNSKITAVFNTETGALTELMNNVTGWKVLTPAIQGPCFEMLIPLEEKHNNCVNGYQTCTVLAAESDRVCFRFENLRTPCTESLDISFTADIKLLEDRLLFDAEVVNRSALTVECVTYPRFSNITPDATDEALYRMNGGYAGIAKTMVYPTFDGWCGYWGIDVPTQVEHTPNSMYQMLGNDRHGLYTGCHDETLKELVQFMIELLPGHTDSFNPRYPTEEMAGGPVCLQYKVNHFPYANPGEAAALSTICVAPYTGTWHKGLDLYKSWRETWFSTPKTPAWANDIHSWLQIHINSPEDELRCRYTDLKKYGEACAKHGVKAIQLVGWNHGGQDRGNPSHDTDPRLGTAQELKESIEYIQSLGVKVVLFNKYTWSDQSTKWYKEELYKYAAKNPYGDVQVCEGYRYQTPTQLADLNTRRLIPMCHHSKEWRAICETELKKSVDLGADGILYDECQHHGLARLCFDPSHGHHVPANVYASDKLLVNSLRKAAAEKEADFLYSGEAIYDMEYAGYSLSYFRIDKKHIPAERYINPKGNIMAAVTGFNDRGMLNACLRFRYIISYEPYMFKGNLDDFPYTVSYGKKIDALRRTYRAFLWDGTFIDTLECRVESNGAAYEDYAVYKRADGKRAVVIVNNSDERLGLSIAFDGKSSPLSMVSPEAPELAPCDEKPSLAPWSAIVVIEI